MAAKNKRIVFSVADCHRLLDCVQSVAHIIENKKTDAVTSKEKNEAWKRVTESYNLCTTEPRSCDQLRNKYDNLKKEKRRMEAQKRAALYKTGGGKEEQDMKPGTAMLFDKIGSLIATSANGLSANIGDDDSFTLSGAVLDVEQGQVVDAEGISMVLSVEPITQINVISEENAPSTSGVQLDDEEGANSASSTGPVWGDYKPSMLRAPKHELLRTKKRKETDSENDIKGIKMKFLKQEEMRAQELHTKKLELLELQTENVNLQNQLLRIQIDKEKNVN